MARRSKLGLAPIRVKSRVAEALPAPPLTAFEAKIDPYVRACQPGQQLKYLVLRALTDLLSASAPPDVAPQPTTLDLLAAASDNEFVLDTVAQLHSFRELYERCSYQRDEKRALARFFRERYSDIVINNRVSLFFESGATLAHVARELAEPLRGFVRIEEGGRPNIQISTNNVLAYLQFWLISRVPCTTFPWGPPSEHTYGASYGGLEKIEQRRPAYDGSPIDETARREIDRLLTAPFTLTSRTPMLLLGAVTGLQLSDELNLSFREDLDSETREGLVKQLSGCRGPHVGSYHNKIFKRFMYATNLPIVICITADKINCEVRVGESHFILDNEAHWQEFYRNHPVAFCVGCDRRQRSAAMGAFEEMGYEIDASPDTEPTTAFIARNDAFRSRFEHFGVAISEYI
jgi:hypothetical protein